jgi:predicted glutamine amidotransferase
VKALHELNSDYKEFSDDAVAVVSEPLNDLTDHWEEISESTLVEVHQGHVVCKPFVPRRPESKQA